MILSIFSITVFCHFLCAATSRSLRNEKPWENKYLFEGDIVLRTASKFNADYIDFYKDKRSAIPDENSLWPDGIIYYGITSSLESEREKILAAMHHIEDRTCIRFKEDTSTEAYVVITKDVGCYSHVGRDGIPQPLSLGRGCLNLGTIVHELVHAIGFYHEHTRSDRDNYIDILWDNIDPEYDDQFEKLKPFQNLLLNDFDYESIMMYGATTFSLDGFSTTMKAKRMGIELIEVRHKKGLSESDVERINKLYKCPMVYHIKS